MSTRWRAALGAVKAVLDESPKVVSNRQLELKKGIDNLLARWTVDVVQSADESEISEMKALLSHGEELEIWSTPDSWAPMSPKSNLSCHLPSLIVHFLPRELRVRFRPEDLSHKDRVRRPIIKVRVRGSTTEGRLLRLAVVQFVRLLVLKRIGPSGVGSKGRGRPLDPSTIFSQMRCLAEIFAKGLAKRLKTGRTSIKDIRFLGFVERKDFSDGPRAREVMVETNRLDMLVGRELWNDPLQPRRDIKLATPLTGEKIGFEGGKPRVPFKPLPDDYVSEMGLHCQWIILNLGPAVLRVGEQMLDLWVRTERLDASKSAISQMREDRVKDLLAKAIWEDCEGVPIFQLPFSEDESVSKIKRWPARTLKDYLYLLKLVQAAHLFVLGMSAPGRSSEVMSFSRDGLKEEVNGQVASQGRTWKLEPNLDGESKNWSLPALAVDAFKQQCKVARLFETIARRWTLPSAVKEGTHLWCGASGQKVRDGNLHLVWLACALGMSPRSSGQLICMHRFRKTIARLAALAMVNAPKVLMDVFGHRDITTTLYYILEDKDLQAEIEVVSRELRVMYAQQAVEDFIDDEGSSGGQSYGGPAAFMIGSAVDAMRASLHQRGEDWGASTARELAEIVTLQGKAWTFVRPGIMCTKYPNAAPGPCSNGRRAPELSRCQSHCKHRLEEPFLRDDVERNIQACVREFAAAKEVNNCLTKSFWAAQLRIHLPRFPEIEARWRAEYAVTEMLAFEEPE